MVEKTLNYAKETWAKIASGIRMNEIIILLIAVLSGRASILLGIAPFGVACSAGYLRKGYAPWTSIFPVIGYLLSGGGVESVKYIAAIFLIAALSYKMEWFPQEWMWKTVCGGLLFASGLVFFIVTGVSYYEMILLAIECILVGVLSEPYHEFVTYFSGSKLRRTMTKDELGALAVVAFLSLTALIDIRLPFELTISGVLSSFAILFCALVFPVGTCAVVGITAGIISGLANPEMIFSVGAYGVAAVAASLCRRYRKPGVILAFVLSNAVMTFYINGSTQVLINIYEVFIAGGILMAVPMKKLREIKEGILLLMPWGTKKETKRLSNIKQFTVSRLEKISQAFSTLSASLIRIEKSKTVTPEKDIEMIIENVAQRVCKNCKNCNFCWDEQFDETYDIVQKLLMVIERRGWVENYDLPAKFKNVCYYPSNLVLETNKVYELYRVNMVWESKIAESRQLISQQLEGVSQAVESLADEIHNDISFEQEMEQEIITILDTMGVKVVGVTVMNTLKQRLRVHVDVRDCKGMNKCDREILATLNAVTGKNMTRVNEKECDTHCSLEYKEDENFRVETAVSRVRPKGVRQWGDSYAIIHPDDGKLIVALSDGMGTGEAAARESNETVDLLDKLLTAGIERETAIKLINSVLILKSYEESFATLDMVVIDLYTGEGEFVKTGGVSSYIKRKKQIIEVQSGSLPTGIIGGVEASNYKLTLKHNDLILIVSDGVTDVDKTDDWLKEAIRDAEDRNVQEIANDLMACACQGMTECLDDMTIIAVQIEEK